MHGIPKCPRDSAAIARKHARNIEYLEQANDLLARYRSGNYELDNLKDLDKALALAPLDYTLWNYRAKIIMKNKSPELVLNEFKFINKAI